jgi:CDP-diacylglycerol--glycerol-3-phosphate 3-phosphatidyltransferase
LIDLKARGRASRVLDPVGRIIGATGIPPTVITFLGLAIAVGGAVFIATGRLFWGALVGGIGALVDAIDGPVARAQGSASIRGAFVDTMSDRVGEVAAWTGLIYYLRHDALGVGLSSVAMAFSLLVPYVRSKAESWGAEGRGGIMGRAERMIVFYAGIGLYDLGLDLLFPMLWAMVVLTGLTVLQRSYRTWVQLGG